MRKFENCDLFAVMGKIVEHHTELYKSDFENDKEIILKAAQSDREKPRRLLWLCRPTGTHCFQEQAVYTKGVYAYNTWLYCAENTSEDILAFEVEVNGVQDGVLRGNLYELDYDEHYKKVKERACPIFWVNLIYNDGKTEKKRYNPQKKDYFDDPNVRFIEFTPKNADLFLTMEKFDADRKNTQYYPWDMDKLKMQYGEFHIPTMEIYQLKYTKETDKMRFSSYSRIKEYFNKEIESKNYHLVYVTPKDDMHLGDIWERFNIHHPEDYHAYSLSVSDVIVINDCGHKNAYFVDSYDFVKLPYFFGSDSGAGKKPDLEM